MPGGQISTLGGGEGGGRSQLGGGTWDQNIRFSNCQPSNNYNNYKNKSFQKVIKSNKPGPWAPKGSNLLTCWYDLGFPFPPKRRILRQVPNDNFDLTYQGLSTLHQPLIESWCFCCRTFPGYLFHILCWFILESMKWEPHSGSKMASQLAPVAHNAQQNCPTTHGAFGKPIGSPNATLSSPSLIFLFVMDIGISRLHFSWFWDDSRHRFLRHALAARCQAPDTMQGTHIELTSNLHIQIVDRRTLKPV